MALSNMKREPRREWSEQIVGMIGVPLLLLVLYWSGGVLARHTDPTYANTPISDHFGGMVAICVVVAGLFFLGIGVWHLSHIAGELLCDLLAIVGLDPRPKWRVVSGERVKTYKDGYAVRSCSDEVRGINKIPPGFLNKKYGYSTLQARGIYY